MSQQKRNRQILTYPNPYLREEAARVEVFDESLSELFDEMCALMHESDGVGLAATQVGESLQLLVLSSYVFLSDSERQEILDQDGDMGANIAVINPEVIEQSEEMINADEGCLSFPGVYIKVKRPVWVKIRAQRIDGSEFEIEGEGLGARAILHEIDHLTGKVMTDHLAFLDRQKALRDHQRIQKNKKLKAQSEHDDESASRSSKTKRSRGGSRKKNTSKRGSRSSRPSKSSKKRR